MQLRMGKRRCQSLIAQADSHLIVLPRATTRCPFILTGMTSTETSFLATMELRPVLQA